MTELVREIREIAGQYPDARSAILPALHLAQERNDGWLPPQALAEVGAALGVTPAYAQSVASYYDMLHLEPVGRHLVEVCTNVSCALVGAQQVVEAFQRELGVRPGETTDDGQVTLKTMECAGGCGWAPVVVVDHGYREPLKPEDVAGVVQELRGG
jgi:NADH-quinone oxidoreductase subunit E